MKHGIVSFHVRLWAGRTDISPQCHDEIYREHGMDGWILNYTVAGAGIINRRNSPFIAKPRDLLLFKPEVCHDYTCDPDVGKWSHLWIYFFPRIAWHDNFTWPEAAPGILRLSLQQDDFNIKIQTLMEEIISIVRYSPPARGELAMCLLEQLFLRCAEISPAADGTLPDSRLARVMKFMAERCSERLSLSALAATANLSPSRFSHLFQGHTGISPMQYLEQVRMRRAGELLLLSDAPVARVARETGYANPFHFSRVFSQHYGVSPRQYRKPKRESVS